MLPHRLNGGCHCGNLRVEVELSQAAESYNPRACDCDFCRRHAAAYLSDAQGSLLIHVGEESQRGGYRQGSGQAEFLVCRNCGVLVAVCFSDDARLYGAVNVRALDAGVTFGPEQTVSPQKLSGDEKARRWRDAWFANVSLVNVAA